MMETDVLVIGAGPAGSTAAKHAALGGAQVIVIDKKSEIGSPKRCAEGVSKDGLKKLGIEPSSRWVTREATGVRMVSPNGTAVNLTEDKVKLPEAGYILERKIFDKHMAMDAARAGARIMVKTLATGMRREDDQVVVTAENMGQELEIKAKIVIAADGPESRVGRWAGLRTALAPKNMESCAQFEMAGVQMAEPDCIEFHFGSVAPGGYAWIFPKGDDIANVGLGILTTRTDKTAYQHLLEFVESNPATQNAQPVELNVGGDPVGGLLKKKVADNVLVTGDAASMVNPLTGGGIISGMLGGRIAGQVAAQAVADGDYSHKNLKVYEKLCDDELGESFKKYLKAKEYLLSLSDGELDEIADVFKDSDFETINTAEMVKKLIKISPKALLKLGKLF
ncbi:MULTISPECIES: NAD(P)/FAD-dependent oxidoreductase [Methanobacterium]|jgi:digeranylgeranylglycerophospholipid reductase|uniref:Digeranylgeranylglycerophospholipid reductase n=1 Tax=Methanobacterium formicicum TaxID=2162 RepID=A0A090I518_METFO|nr:MULTISPECIES: NAD(P)/FAD-dependent oxidoreductase [Methanobacterium]KUK74834.1 MAG: Digeranylgeranylglycerophospholipid reductase [Methanobacterium sp. 42_16]MBF4474156.1 NAD(P)/FAD-dependent oxidoreductase [Methanobacterium formicicum]MDD4810708.1 NAD(P)/FAD-dependent oxidoreductase [Methanobacterium formicicum]MDH2659347.1 NAD(P)/FAD-dependent oxidoreductase [Methanobacterium formicicum]CEA14641.1 Digeranylgeranylglycerophospholipid reductase 1 [Methanobacterium formicicum]